MLSKINCITNYNLSFLTQKDTLKLDFKCLKDKKLFKIQNEFETCLPMSFSSTITKEYFGKNTTHDQNQTLDLNNNLICDQISRRLETKHFLKIQIEQRFDI